MRRFLLSFFILLTLFCMLSCAAPKRVKDDLVFTMDYALRRAFYDIYDFFKDRGLYVSNIMNAKDILTIPQILASVEPHRVFTADEVDIIILRARSGYAEKIELPDRFAETQFCLALSIVDQKGNEYQIELDRESKAARRGSTYVTEIHWGIKKRRWYDLKGRHEITYSIRFVELSGKPNGPYLDDPVEFIRTWDGHYVYYSAACSYKDAVDALVRLCVRLSSLGVSDISLTRTRVGDNRQSDESGPFVFSGADAVISELNYGLHLNSPPLALLNAGDYEIRVSKVEVVGGLLQKQQVITGIEIRQLPVR